MPVAPLLNQNVQDLAFVINGPPEVRPPAADPDPSRPDVIGLLAPTAGVGGE